MFKIMNDYLCLKKEETQTDTHTDTHTDTYVQYNINMWLGKSMNSVRFRSFIDRG